MISLAPSSQINPEEKTVSFRNVEVNMEKVNGFFFVSYHFVFGKEDLNGDNQKYLENTYVKSLIENRECTFLLLK